MPWEIFIAPSNDFVEVKISGGLTSADLARVFEQVVVIEKASGIRLVLVDGTEAEVGGVSDAEIYFEISRRIAAGVSLARKQAVVLPASLAGDQLGHFYETASINRHFTVKAFTSRERAIAWLLE